VTRQCVTQESPNPGASGYPSTIQEPGTRKTWTTRGVESMSTKTQKKGISLFRAKDAVDLMDTDLMSKPEMSPDTEAAFGTTLAAGLGAGAQTKVLLRQSKDEGGFSLVTLWFKPGYPLPRHTHNVDCLYYVIS